MCRSMDIGRAARMSKQRSGGTKHEGFYFGGAPVGNGRTCSCNYLCQFEKKVSKEDGKKLEQRMALGMSLGLLFGAALNNCGLWGNHALGLVMGPLWGMALASLWKEE